MSSKQVWQQELTLQTPAAIDLRRTVLSHGWWEIPPFHWDDGSRTLAVAVAGPRRSVRRLEIRQPRPGPGRTLRLRWLGRGTGKGTARAAAELEAEGRALARRVLSLDWDLREFHALCERHEPLAWVPRSGAGRVLRGPSVFSDVVSSICGTNTTWTQAKRSICRLAELAPTDPSGVLHRFPTAAELQRAGAGFLRDHGRVGYRADFIVELCNRVVSGDLDLDVVLRSGVGGEELRAFFRSLPGIGPVTARYLAVLYGHFDSLAVDSLVVTYIGDKYLGGRRATEKEVQALYEPFGKLKALAYWFEFLGDVDPVTWRGWEKSECIGKIQKKL
ncbi:MAG: hypothetical protein ABI333_08170 [bacterium]